MSIQKTMLLNINKALENGSANIRQNKNTITLVNRATDGFLRNSQTSFRNTRFYQNLPVNAVKFDFSQNGGLWKKANKNRSMTTILLDDNRSITREVIKDVKKGVITIRRQLFANRKASGIPMSSKIDVHYFETDGKKFKKLITSESAGGDHYSSIGFMFFKNFKEEIKMIQSATNIDAKGQDVPKYVMEQANQALNVIKTAVKNNIHI